MAKQSNQLSIDDWSKSQQPNPELVGKTFYIVDGSSYIYRAFFAIRHLSNSKGFPTNAIYGFTQMIKKLIEAEDPDYLAVTFDAFDAEEKTFRKKLYPEYKAQRKEMPEDLQIQVPYFEKVVRALNIPVMVQVGVEADDLIATATRRAQKKGMNVCIISADKDLMQLLGDGVTMLDTMRDKRYTPVEAHERFNVTPEKIRYVLALAGDTSDNIPGVPGIGEKTGGALIAEFGDLENLLANIDKVSGKKRKENLENFADQARLSLELVTLREDCPIEFDIEDLRVSPPDLSELTLLFKEFEFDSILKDLKTWMKKRGWLDGTSKADGAREIVAAEGKNYRAIHTEKELDEVLAALQDCPRFAFDLETTSLDPLEAEIVGMSFCWKADHAVYIPVAHEYDGVRSQLSCDLVMKKVKSLLEEETPRKIGQHYKYEWLVLRKYGIDFKGIAFDTMLMSYLLDPGKNSHSLDTIAYELLGHRTIKFSDVAGSGRAQKTFDEVLLEEATIYAAEDADITFMACEVMEPKLIEEGLKELHDDLEVPLSRVLAQMEHRGVRVDENILSVLSVEFEEEIEKLQAQINELAGGALNPNSPKQLREVLFEKLGLPVKKRTQSGPSTDQSVLEQLTELHELPAMILEYRSFVKLKGTYVDALPELVHPKTGRIHTDFNQAVAATGRLSSSNPNLQNIPIRTARGREIRRAFVPDAGFVLLAADYSQIELRIMAHMAKDPMLLKAYQQDQDIHAFTASQVFDVPLEDVTRDQRSAGKTINFGVMYGMGARRLARSLGISSKEAKKYIDNYFERYQGVTAYFDGLVESAKELGYAETMFGRKRHLPGINTYGAHKAFGERAAINTPIQGTAADIIKFAMINIQRHIEDGDLPVRMLLQVHDELVFEIPEGDVDECRGWIVDKMENVVKLDVPLKVDVGVGTNWLDTK
ncbi:MAG: DNA polymerase I [Bradymonadaceae bacterium]